MCLTNNPTIVDRLLKSPKQTYTVYKIVKRHRKRKVHIYAPFERREYRHLRIVSNYPRKAVPCLYNDNLTLGIHTYRTKSKAMRVIAAIGGPNWYVVRAYGLKRHLLGASKQQMLFKEIRLDAKDVAKVLGG